VGLWPTKEEWPVSLNQGWIFVLMAGTWLLLGWQAHVPLTAVHITGIGLVLVAAAFGVLVGRWLDPMPEDSVQPLPQSLLRKQGKVFLLLLGVLLLWPREAVLTLFPLAVALLAGLALVPRPVRQPCFPPGVPGCWGIVAAPRYARQPAYWPFAGTYGP
jgi:hypothetical protein